MLRGFTFHTIINCKWTVVAKLRRVNDRLRLCYWCRCCFNATGRVTETEARFVAKSKPLKDDSVIAPTKEEKYCSPDDKITISQRPVLFN